MIYPSQETVDLATAYAADERKALMLIAMLPEQRYSFVELDDLMAGAAGLLEENELLLGRGAFNEYCKAMLPVEDEPALIQEHRGRFGRRLGFSLTEYGIAAQSVVGAMLDLSLDNSIQGRNLSLYKIFGLAKTGKGGTSRAPINRRNILAEVLGLYENNQLPIRIKQLANLMDSYPTLVFKHIKHFENIGALEYRSPPQRKPFQTYSLSNTRISSELNYKHPKYPDLTDQILWLFNQGSADVTTEELEELFEQSWLERHSPIGRKINRRQRTHNISVVCEYLKSLDVLEVTSTLTHEERTKIYLHPDPTKRADQYRFISQVVQTFTSFQTDPEAAVIRGNQRANEILRSPQLVRELVNKAQRTSPYLR